MGNLRQISVGLSQSHIEWLDATLNRSRALRMLIDWAIKNNWSPTKMYAPPKKQDAIISNHAECAKALSAYAHADESMSEADLSLPGNQDLRHQNQDTDQHGENSRRLNEQSQGHSSPITWGNFPRRGA